MASRAYDTPHLYVGLFYRADVRRVGGSRHITRQHCLRGCYETRGPGRPKLSVQSVPLRHGLVILTGQPRVPSTRYPAHLSGYGIVGF